MKNITNIRSHLKLFIIYVIYYTPLVIDRIHYIMKVIPLNVLKLIVIHIACDFLNELYSIYNMFI